MRTPDDAVEPPLWQWTLQDLLIGTMYVAALCAAMVFFGSDSSSFLGFLFFSLLMTASLAFSDRKGVVPVIGISCCFGIASIPLLANCVMHLAFVGWQAIRNKPVSRKIRVHVSLFFLFLSIAGVLTFGLGSYRELLELRKRFPLQNLSQRLKYERDLADSLRTTQDRARSRMTDRWKDFELTLLTDLGTYPDSRNHYLRQIIDRKVESSLKSRRFGFSRMAFYQNPRGGVLPDLENVPFQYADENRPITLEQGIYWMAPQWRVNDEPLDFHFAGLQDFLNTTSYGLMVEPQVTIGFEPHAFHFSAEPIEYENDIFVLSNLQLVSLRRFDAPRVYVLDHLPRMDQLSADDVPTRKLNHFEAESLKNIRDNNDDVVLELTDNRLVMLGSIRAVQSCLDCHTAGRGELLGAFTYQFKKTSEVKQK